MKIFGKKEVTDTTIAPVTTDLNGMTYKEFISQEQNAEIKRCKDEIKVLDTSITEAEAERKQGGSNQGTLAEFISKAQEQVVKLEKELAVVPGKMPIDQGLSMIAGQLDRADGYNKAVDLLAAAVKKAAEAAALLTEAVIVCGGEFYAPALVGLFKVRIDAVIITIADEYNNAFRSPHKVDKDALKKSFEERLATVQADKKRAAAMASKFKIS